MRFSIYGRHEIEIEREGGRWVVYRRGIGTRCEIDFFIPADVAKDDLATYLDDVLHEDAEPGRSIRRID